MTDPLFELWKQGKISAEKYFQMRYSSEANSAGLGAGLGNPVFDATKAIDMVLKDPGLLETAITYLGDMRRLKVDYIHKLKAIGKLREHEDEIEIEKLDKEDEAVRRALLKIAKP